LVEHSFRRDSALIDAIEAIEPVYFSGPVWRVVREGRDPCQCSRSGGRWDDGTFDVLYTALGRDGAAAEMYFHLKRGQPIMPSRVRYHLYELRATMDRALKLLDLAALGRLGLDMAAFGRLSYQERVAEYPRSQDIGETAHFLEFDGLIVPSARWEASNAVLFCDYVQPEMREAVTDHGPLDWSVWERQAGG
jgi:RES domain-containing protein